MLTKLKKKHIFLSSENLNCWVKSDEWKCFNCVTMLTLPCPQKLVNHSAVVVVVVVVVPRRSRYQYLKSCKWWTRGWTKGANMIWWFYESAKEVRQKFKFSNKYLIFLRKDEKKLGNNSLVRFEQECYN